MFENRRRILTGIALLLVSLLTAGCSQEKGEDSAAALRVPRGYQQTWEIPFNGRIVTFGPFMGYYFKPIDPNDLTRLSLLCFNEENFYTNDLPRNAKLFTGEAVFTVLPPTDHPVPSGPRINPVFFPEAPQAWKDTRPDPQDEFLHFHSCHDATGPAMAGFWIRHVGAAAFTYDMGGRVTPESPLYHRVTEGPDKGFARIIEFDRGPDPG